METWAFHWVDLLIVSLLAFGAFVGANVGFKGIVTRIIAYVAAVYFTAYAHAPVRDFLATHIARVHEAIPILLSYVFTFVATYLTLLVAFWGIRKLLVKWRVLPDELMLEEWVKKVGLKPVDRLLGAGVGTAFAFGMVCLLVAGANYMRVSAGSPFDGSKLGEKIVAFNQDVADSIPQTEFDRLKHNFGDLKDLLSKWFKDLRQDGLDKLENTVQQGQALGP